MNVQAFLIYTSAIGLCLAASAALACSDKAANRYTQAALVANKTSTKAQFTNSKFINAWGIAIRPVGAGGHFWVTAKDHSFEYVGDVQNATNEKLRKLHQDKLTQVKLPVGGPSHFATGVVFSDSLDSFEVTQKLETGTVSAPAKFLFASDGGIISGWTERRKADGSFERPVDAVAVIDESKQGAQFYGLALNRAYTRLYVADFGAAPTIKVFDHKFKPAEVTFDTPFDDNKNGKVDSGEYAPFNVQGLKTPDGAYHIFVTYAMTKACPKAEMKKGTCKEDELFAGEEDTAKPGLGRLAEFDEDGKLIAVWKDGGKLSAPWGITFAPANFGAFSNSLLVGNFGDGTIAAYNPTTREFIDVMRDHNARPIKIDKLWGLLFGNGESLGDSDALYFAAGPNDEKNGIFGSLRALKDDNNH